MNRTPYRRANKRESQVTFLKVLFGTKIQADHQEELFKIDHWMNRYLIHPSSLWRRLWDTVAILLVVYTTFVLPARTAFLWEVRSRSQKQNAGVGELALLERTRWSK